MPAPQASLTPAFFTFFRSLASNNTAAWFAAHKAGYERDVKAPLLAFVAALQPHMARVSPRIRVEAKAVGGSLQRLNRDTRFSKDKSPYKTAAGLMFMVQDAGELMLGYHLSLAPGASKGYVGIWEPDTAGMNRLRGRILSHPAEWQKAVPPAFRAAHTFEGESLKRPPKVNELAVPEDHPLLEDLKRKSFAASVPFADKAVCADDFLERYMDTVRAGAPLTQFLCRTLGVEF